MSLHDYQKKRKFDKTPEPKGLKKQNSGALTFVIQKHQASRLHYDFRLELNGVLKSWAIPKGPSMNPDDKRLAVMVEDHPTDYADFEGIIPKGNYGGGTVMVWDRGVYSPIAFVDRKKAEIILEEQVHKGHLTFVLLGEKLRGEFALVKTFGREENQWLLIKAHDEYANKEDVTKLGHSVMTNRSMDEITKQAQGKNEIWISKPKTTSGSFLKARAFLESDPGGVIQNTHEKNNSELTRTAMMTFLKGLPKSSMPQNFSPMLAQSTDEPFDDNDWIFELKYDGYRAIAEISRDKVNLYSRNNLSLNDKFAPIVESLKKFPEDVVLDGEVVVIDEKGHPQFQWLQDYPKTRKGELVYYVFDILYFDSHNLTTIRLIQRKKLLKQILPKLPHIAFADHIESTGITMFRLAKKLDLEGIMAKKIDSSYMRGERTNSWLKIKTQKRQEVVIAGFTQPKSGRKYFGSLITGVYKRGQLQYVGHVGGGFDDQSLETIYLQLKPLIQENCPFSIKPKTNTPALWVSPKLIAEVTFSQWTQDGQMRHPVFLGMREDKIPEYVTEERYFEPEHQDKKTNNIAINKKEIRLTNLSKIFWPKENYTKGDLVKYYKEIARIILPYLHDRPESLLRYPNGITGKSFYQKDAKLLESDWIPTVKIYSESNNKNVEYLLCQDEATLVYLINLGCIDLNPWSSRVSNLENPDYLLIDLDPEETDFKNVVTTALSFRELFETLNIPSSPKTSGAKGLHIYVPLGGNYTYEQSRQLAELLCIHINNKIPGITSMKRNPMDRKKRVYLDYLQNSKGQTLASVYSVRAQPGATVSTPLLWSEVNDKLHPSQFTIRNMQNRIQKHGDLFKGIFKNGIDIKKLLEKMSNF